MDFDVVKIQKPDEVNFILVNRILLRLWKTCMRQWLQQSRDCLGWHFVKPQIRGWCAGAVRMKPVRISSAQCAASWCKYCFIIFLAAGFYPINVLNAIKQVPEVCHIFCASANPTEVLIAQTDLGRGIIGVVDGKPPLGVEQEKEIAARKDLLRRFGYKF